LEEGFGNGQLASRGCTMQEDQLHISY
jgi:hypothetical protein